jgi:glycosyltransferase involved in cell wall biosynthesis
MSLPRISVVTPSFNQGQFLEETILSVLDQNYPDLEYIIIDGGSTDSSVDIISTYANRLAYWESEPDRGQAHAINKGFARATGQILCWINSDDFFLPNVFEQLVSFFQPAVQAERAQLFYGGCRLFDAERNWTVKRQPPAPFDRELYRVFAFFDQPSTFWTRRLWEETGPLDESMHYSFDWEWFNRAADHGEFKAIPFPVSAYRFHRSQKTGGGDLGLRRREIREIVGRYASEDWMKVYQAVDERILPGIKRLRWLNRVRGAWRLERSAEWLWRRARYAEVYLLFGSSAVERALTMLDV